MLQSKKKLKVAIIGAGPAGLTAAYQLLKADQSIDIEVFEKHPHLVGGISRTESYKGYYFDIGGHRFFSKSAEVENFWTEILGDEMLERPRSSRIFYNGKFFSYPLQAFEALRKLGIFESARCMISFFWAQIKPIKNPENFEEWVSNEFGKRLYTLFFKTYTEKVWGIPCTKISADWAAQRIKGLSLGVAIKNALLPGQNKNNQVKTLLNSFRYPKYGPGQMWQVCKERVEAMGGKVQMGKAVKRLEQKSDGQWLVQTADGVQFSGFDYLISSAPIRELFASLKPFASESLLAAANGLAYRDFLTVVLILKDQYIFDDNWIYIHDPSVKVGRIQHFKSWSPYMVPDETMVCYGLEYFCFEGDGLWNSPDETLSAMAKTELEKIGLGFANEVVDSYVVRQAKAYPVYDQGYQQKLEIIRNGLEAYPGLILVGRNGMHKYNNQDHSMMTAMLAAKNIIAGKPIYDLWQVNQDAEYHETGGIPRDTHLQPNSMG